MKKSSKLLTKSISAVLIFMLVLTAVLPTAGLSATATEAKGKIYYAKEYYDSHKKLCDEVVNALKSFEEEIYIIEYDVTPEDVENLYYFALYTNPELFYVDLQFSYCLNQATGYIIYLAPIYLYTKAEVAEKKIEIDKKASEYLSKINDGMTDFQKAMILHDEIVMNSEYSDGATLYDLIVGGKGKCSAYSITYSYLLSLVGINTEIVTSDSMNHEWNKVEIDGKYYNVDLTWDDPLPDKLGKVNHKNFLLSDAAFESGNNGKGIVHSDFDKTYFKATSTKYDGYDVMHAINTKFCFADNSFYCIDNQYLSKYEKCLLKYNEANDTVKTLHWFDAYWRASETSYWAGGHSSLDEYDEVLYCNTDDEIYYYDVETKKLNRFETSLKLNGKCYGLVIRDKKLYAVIADNPNVTGTLQYAGDCILKTPVYETGDVDRNGKISIQDVTLIQKYAAGCSSLDSEQLLIADADGNGTVNVSDATYIQKMLVSAA